ncbi:hypothetical protein K402DRAFT_425018 [Aulographum hederae CBS 113979]|uniref:Fork-head domain-containing protein n=1 Tax=Aulographum hederae CBS 113979 TaxID=1176131 RepID=A0A6G1GLY1_9PEZI|nr:hypothetical protein K402DRAFT_425018 [Aulographum hederae CBS 113979]
MATSQQHYDDEIALSLNSYSSIAPGYNFPNPQSQSQETAYQVSPNQFAMGQPNTITYDSRVFQQPMQYPEPLFEFDMESNPTRPRTYSEFNEHSLHPMGTSFPPEAYQIHPQPFTDVDSPRLKQDNQFHGQLYPDYSHHPGMPHDTIQVLPEARYTYSDYDQASRHSSPAKFMGSGSGNYDQIGACGAQDPMDCQSPGTPGDKEEPYAKLIFRCLLGAEEHTMVLRDIYDWFRQNTDKGRDKDAKGWQNSIRHNLSMNKAFEKVEQAQNDEQRRGFLWRLTDKAIREGVKSTTRYRSKQPNKRPPRSHHPDPTRQASGARGGQAAKKSARLRRSARLQEGGLLAENVGGYTDAAGASGSIYGHHLHQQPNIGIIQSTEPNGLPDQPHQPYYHHQNHNGLADSPTSSPYWPHQASLHHQQHSLDGTAPSNYMSMLSYPHSQIPNPYHHPLPQTPHPHSNFIRETYTPLSISSLPAACPSNGSPSDLELSGSGPSSASASEMYTPPETVHLLDPRERPFAVAAQDSSEGGSVEPITPQSFMEPGPGQGSGEEGEEGGFYEDDMLG